MTLERRRFTPEDRGRIVTSFLTKFFNKYVEYDFTAQLEEKLDEVSDGSIEWKKVLREFWIDFEKAVEETGELRLRSVIDALDDELGTHFFPAREDGSEPRSCPECKQGRLGLRLGKHGPFIGCTEYPTCKFTRPLSMSQSEENDSTPDKVLGNDTKTGKEISLRNGRYGLYVQLGTDPEDKGEDKPKRTAIPRGIDFSEVDLQMAIGLLDLPRDIGLHPEDNNMVQAHSGRFGPYIKHGKNTASLPEPRDVLSIGLNHAITLLADKSKSRGRSSRILRELGLHPSDEKLITLQDGRYGPYIKHGKINASVPKSYDLESLTLDEAITLLAQKTMKKQSKSRKKTTRKKKA